MVFEIGFSFFRVVSQKKLRNLFYCDMNVVTKVIYRCGGDDKFWLKLRDENCQSFHLNSNPHKICSN